MFAELTNSKFHTAEFIPVEDMKHNTGYRSVFAWSREDADAAVAAGTVKVLKDRPAFADTIFVDFDNNKESAYAFRQRLLDEDFLYEMYTSGGRSIHFHISMVPQYDIRVPYSVRNFMQNFKQFAYDPSVYNYCSLFRLSGTVHEKTGKPKTLIEQDGFYHVSLDLLEPPKINLVTTDHDALAVAIALYTNYLGGGVAEGGRYTVQWKVAKAFQEAGLSFDTALELVLAMDESWKNLSKGMEETKRAVKDAYRI
jgi:hypothetical protein